MHVGKPRNLELPPWSLSGSGYIFMPRISNKELLLELPPQSKNFAFFSRPLLIFCDYVSTNVGDYSELLFIPGRIQTKVGVFWHISRVFVSGIESMEASETNWGVKKELADFHIVDNRHKGHHISISIEDHIIFEAHVLFPGLQIPIASDLLPPYFFHFYQQNLDTKYIFRPSIKASWGFARSEQIAVEAQALPYFDIHSTLLTLRLHEFFMVLPDSNLILPTGN